MPEQNIKFGEYPAYPNGIEESFTGLTIREYFAIRILQSLIANPTQFQPKGLDLVQDARQYADALIKELSDVQTD